MCAFKLHILRRVKDSVRLGDLIVHWYAHKYKEHQSET